MAPAKKQNVNRPKKPSVTMDLREKMLLFSLPCIVLAAVAMLLIGANRQRQIHSVNKLLAEWKVSYNLTPEQMAEIKRLELEFHGTGNPFTSPVPKDAASVTAHHVEISKLMKPEEGERFLKAMEARNEAH